MGKTFGDKIAKVHENKDSTKLAIKKKLREMKNDIDQHNPIELKKFYQE
jgi:iron-sulfur cluster repair protein YtfE (RIC family)